MGGATGEGNLPALPHQPVVEVRMAPVKPGEPSEPQGVPNVELLPYVAVLQVHLDRQINDAPIVERIDQFLGLRIDPTDLWTCAFGAYHCGWLQKCSNIPGCNILASTNSISLSAELIRALWDLTCSCFARLNGPQRVRVLERLAGRHSGHVLQQDVELLTVTLFGDDASMSQGDPLLTGIHNTAYGMVHTS